MDEKRCRYCRYQSAPYYNGKLADPATEYAELSKAIHELNMLITAFCEKWHIAVHGRTPDIEEMLKNRPPAHRSREGKEGKD